MEYVTPLLLCLCAAFVYALSIKPILCGTSRTYLKYGFALCPLFFPLLIATDQVILRALVSLPCTELMFKLVDTIRSAGSKKFGYADYARFLLPFPPFLVVFGQRRKRCPRQHAAQHVIRFVTGLTSFALCFALLLAANTLSLLQTHFLADHGLKLLIFVLAIESLSQMFWGLERLLRYDTMPPMRGFFRSVTVAEFWYRYNHRVHYWYDQNIFRPCGGWRNPTFSVGLTFLISAIHHEIGFGFATSRFDGYQFTFFLIQVPAVLLSRVMTRIARRSTLHALTIRSITLLWFYFTSILFFHGVHRVFPFYYAGPSWLP